MAQVAKILFFQGGIIMKKHAKGQIGWRVLVISLVVALACACASMGSLSQKAYDPPSNRGPIVILLSGASGMSAAYTSYAAQVSRLGYYAVLLNGNDFHPKYGKSATADLRRIIEQAQSSPKAIPGKAAVIGFSMGGGDALTHAAGMPELVSVLIAYYPMTMHITNMNSFVSQFKVPILVLAGEKDTYLNCCLIESMRAMEAAAKEGGKPFELVVYPNAGHAFTWEDNPSYRAEASADAWQRTTKMLSQYQPLP
jgi:dienelactone hydrolase